MEARYEGADPEANPLAGLPEEVQETAAEEAVDVVATAVTFRVDVVFQG